MSRYVKSIEVKKPKALMSKVFYFLYQNGFRVGDFNIKQGEAVWKNSGFNCWHFVITEFKPDTVVITAFITYTDMVTGREYESTIKGFLGGFGKWPLKKKVRLLEKIIVENKDFDNSEAIGIDGIPRVFTDKFKIFPTNINETIERFNKDFGLENYALPDGFLNFSKSELPYRMDGKRIEPIEYDKILEIAYNLLYGSDVFNLPPHCIPFAKNESGCIYALDYRYCGSKGEPDVILFDYQADGAHIDNEDIVTYGFKKNSIAKNFDEFLKLCGIKTDDAVIERS